MIQLKGVTNKEDILPYSISYPFQYTVHKQEIQNIESRYSLWKKH